MATKLDNYDLRQTVSTWSNVQHFFIKGPTGKSSQSSSFRLFRSCSASDRPSESFDYQQGTNRIVYRDIEKPKYLVTKRGQTKVVI